MLALGGLVVGYLFLDERHPLLYRGGFLLVAGLTAVAIMAATHAGARLIPVLLGWRPLRWIGVRSYSIYLWHWPIFAVTRPHDDLPFTGWQLLVLRLALTIPLADLSYRYIEQPICDGAWRNARQAFRRLWLMLVQRSPMVALAGAAAGGAPRSGVARRPRGRRMPWSPHRPQSGGAAPQAEQDSGTTAPRHLARPRDGGRQRARFVGPSCGLSQGERGTWLLPTAVRLRVANIILISLLLISTATCASSVGMPVAPTPSAPQVSPALPSATAAPPAASATAVPPAPTAAPEAPTAAPVAPTVVPAIPTAAPARPSPQLTAPELPPIPAALAADLQRILDETVASGAIPGASVAVHIPGYQTWTGASGVAARGVVTPMTPTTRLRVASISKVFTAVVVLQLVEEGKLDLDAPLATWFPEIVPKADRITVRMLLQHTSGLYDYLEDQKFVSQAYAAPERTWTPQELVAWAARNRASFAPGAPGRWDYSSTNYVLLGMIVERVTGTTLASEMRRRIFDPLELTSTYFPPQEVVEGPQARGYSTTRDQTNVSMSFAFATANLVSTPEDLQRFGQALFGRELLQPATMESMLQFVDGNGSYKMPELEYGLGVMRNRLPVGADLPPEASRVLGHIGGFGGFRSALWHAPASGITVALGVNQAATDPNILATKVFDAVLRALRQ
jgi:D-alanyl-D-alanine carboxypeptidase